jgi:hypothetical protein
VDGQGVGRFSRFRLARIAYLRYRVRARDARIRVMRGQHQNRSIKDKAIKPPTINIIM